MRHLESVIGIVIRQKPFFEKDKLIEVFTFEQGLIRILDKGATKGRSKFGGQLDVLNLCQFHLNKGKSFFYLSQCDHIETFYQIRKSLDAMHMAFYFLGLILKCTVQGQTNESLFLTLKDSLTRLNQLQDNQKVKAFFQRQLLISEGVLLDDDKSISEEIFEQLFQQYTGKSAI